MADFAETGLVAGELWIGFWPPFDRAWLTPAGSIRDGVVCELLEEIGVEFPAVALASCLGEGLGEATGGGK